MPTPLQRLSLLVVLTLVSAIFNETSGQGWQWQNPRPQGNALTDITFISEGTAIAVGAAGTILRTTNQGQSWDVRQSMTMSMLVGVAFSDDKTGIVIGLDSIVIVTSDGGLTWNTSPFPTALTLRGVCFLDATTALAVGHDGAIMHTTNAGQSWTKQPSGTTSPLFAVASVNATTAIAVGGSGAILQTADKGLSWSTRTSGITGDLTAVCFPDSLLGFAASGRHLLRTINGGQSWTVVADSLPGDINQVISELFFGDPNTGFVVTRSPIGAGDLYRTSNGGASWQQVTIQNFAFGEEVSALSFATPAIGVSVGEKTMRVTSDAGLTWQSVLTGTRNIKKDVAFRNSNAGIVVGDLGGLLRTTNGGTSWTSQSVGLAHHSFDAVHYRDSTNATVVSGTWDVIFRSTDDGNTWSEQFHGTSSGLYDVTYTTATNGIIVGGDGLILHTTNGGQLWNTRASGTTEALRSVHFPVPDTGFAIGDTTFLRTTNGGETWSIVQHPPLNGFTMSKVWFTRTGKGHVLTSQGGVSALWTLGDAGNTWEGGALFPNAMTDIAFSSPQNGILVGVGGAIFRTFNGGSFWSPQFSGTDQMLTAVSLTGQETTIVGLNGGILRNQSGDVADVSLPAREIMLGDVRLGTSKDTTLTVTNTGQDDLMFLDVLVANPAFTAVLRDRLVNPGKATSLRIRFTPTKLGEDGSVILLLTSSASFSDTLLFIGHGVTPTSGISELDIPRDLTLDQNFPNPFNPSTTIRYGLPVASRVRLTVHDMLGREVALLDEGVRKEGFATVVWAPHVASGVYFVRIDATAVGDANRRFVEVRRMVMLK